MNFALSVPVMDGTTTISAVELRRPRVRDIMIMEKARSASGGDDLAAMVALLASVSGLPVATVEELDISDYTKLSAALADFLAPPASEQAAGA